MNPKPLADSVDAALVTQAQSGDMRAFEMLVVKYQRRIERLIGRFMRDLDAVPDLAQETFIRAYRALPQFRGDSAFYTWLYRIAVNTAKQALSERRRDPLRYDADFHVNQDEDQETFSSKNEPNHTETPEALLASRQVAQAVNLAIERLPEEFRQALVLREIEGLSYDEIGEAMNCPAGTVRSRIFRAREAVAAHLKPLLDKPGSERW